MENPIKMDDLGGTTIFGNTHIYLYICCMISIHPKMGPISHLQNQNAGLRLFR